MSPDATPPRTGTGTVTVLPGAAPTPGTPTPNVPAKVGRFEVRRLLGEGAFGRVYEAYDPVLKRAVALKVAKPEQTADKRRVERFQREARAAGLLTHPNIVTVHDWGQDGPHHFIASAFIPGRTLDEALDGKPMEPRRAAEVGRKLAEALAYAHNQSVVHRDVKPANVMLRDDGEPLLMDFGLAARADDAKLTVAGEVLGTPAYCAPEQWRGQAVPASDQYSLGCVLYEMLRGQSPFAGSDAGHYLVLHLHTPVSPLLGIPRDLETIVRKCLEKEPGRRYPGCSALAEDLRRWLAREPISARRVGPLQRVLRWVWRESVVASLVAAVLAVVVAGVAVAWSLTSWGRQQEALAEQREEDVRKQKGLTDEANDRADVARGRADTHAAEATRLEGLATQRQEESRAAQRRAEEHSKRTRLALYAGQLMAAQQEWRDGNCGPAIEILEACPRDLRHFEHHYLWTLYHSNQRTLRGHADGVWCVAYSPDGRRIVSGGDDGVPRVWDAATGREVRALRGHADGVWCVAYSPDGRRIASGGSDETVKLWDADTGRAVHTLKGHASGVLAVAFSPDGRRVVSGDWAGALKLWDVATGKELAALGGHAGGVFGVAFSPDGRRVVSGGGDGELKVWDATTGRDVLTLRAHPAGGVLGVAFSPDGRRVVSAGGDKTLKLWDAVSGREVFTAGGHLEPATGVAFNPDGRHVASSGQDGTWRVWDATTGREVSTLRGHVGAVTAVAFSPDGRRVVSSGRDGALKVWDVATRQGPTDPGGKEARRSSKAVSPDGRRVASIERDGTVKVRDAVTGNDLLTLKGHTVVQSIAFSSDGRRIASGGAEGTVKLWDADTGLEVLTLKEHPRLIEIVMFSPDGRRLVSSTEKGEPLQRWDAALAQNQFVLRGHVKDVRSVGFNSDGKRLRSTDADGRRLDFDTTTGLPIPPDDARVPEGRKDAVQPGTGWLANAEGPAIRFQPPGLPDPLADLPTFAGTTPSWHDREASEAQDTGAAYAGAFHLERLHRMRPDDPHVLLRLSAALAADAPGLDRLRERHRAFTVARAAALVGAPPLVTPALLPAAGR